MIGISTAVKDGYEPPVGTGIGVNGRTFYAADAGRNILVLKVGENLNRREVADLRTAFLEVGPPYSWALVVSEDSSQWFKTPASDEWVEFGVPE